jgi:sulfoxide reductase heme-binding subunit YedZ
VDPGLLHGRRALSEQDPARCTQGFGIVAGWLAAIVGLSFYGRRRIGARTWRRMHRFTILAYVLALAHVVGTGTDVRSPWMIAMLTGLTAPIAFAFSCRVLPGAVASP